MKYIRKKLGLTQQELAVEMGVTQSYISKLENNKEMICNLTLKNVAQIAKKMDICPMELIDSFMRECISDWCLENCTKCNPR